MKLAWLIVPFGVIVSLITANDEGNKLTDDDNNWLVERSVDASGSAGVMDEMSPQIMTRSAYPDDYRGSNYHKYYNSFRARIRARARAQALARARGRARARNWARSRGRARGRSRPRSGWWRRARHHYVYPHPYPNKGSNLGYFNPHSDGNGHLV